MAGSSRAWAEIEHLFRRATLELERAARAGAVAARHERLVRAAPGWSRARELHEKMAQIHRQLGQRHLTAARIHRAHAERLRACLGSGTSSVSPFFMAAVAETSGADSALLSLFGHRHGEALVVTSDKIAAAAHDLEATLDEGPGRDAMAGQRLVAASGGALERRWPLYGPAALSLGIYAAAAIPLSVPDRCLGILTVFGLDPAGHIGTDSLGTVADALTHTMLLGDDERTSGGTAPAGDGGRGYGGTGPATAADIFRMPLPGDGDHLAVMHQAAGMVAGECGCGIGDALAIIRARAFAESEPVEEVAARVVSRELHLCPDPPFPAPRAES